MLAVIRKDLSEQSFVLAPACLLALTGLVVLASRGPIMPDALIGAFDAFVLACVVPLALISVRQLVVVEFVRRGFDALEPLPVSLRWVLLGKLVTGLALIVGVIVAGAGVTTSALRVLIEVPPGATAALAGRAAAFALAVHGAAFLLACTGRHRHGVLFALVAGLALAQRAGWDLERLGPVRLARGGFYGAGDLLDRAAIDSALLGATAIALGFGLASVRRGRLARAWSGPWTAADAGRALAAAMVAVTVVSADHLAERPTVRLEGAVVTQGAAMVRLPAPDHEARAAEVAALVARVTDDWAARAGVPPPAVAVDLAPGLPTDISQRIDGDGALGLVVRTSFTAPSWDAAAFEAFLLRELTTDLARAGHDVALDGLPLWRANLRDERLRRRVELHAAWAVEALGGFPSLADWPTVHERVGPPAARALAAFILEQLAALHGPAAVDRLVEAALRTARPGRGSLARLEAATGARAQDLEAALTRAAAALTTARAADLAALPRPALVQVDAEPDGALRFSVSPGPACAADTPCALVHGPAGARPGARRDEALVGGPAGRTLARYPAGAAVRCGVAVPAPVDGGELLVGWRRVVVSAGAGAGP